MLVMRAILLMVPIGNSVLIPNSVAMRCSHAPSELQRRRKQLQNLPLLKLTLTTADGSGRDVQGSLHLHTQSSQYKAG